MIDATQSPALLIDGVATDVPNNGATPVAAGDGQVFFDGETYTIVFGTGDALKIAVFDGFMNVCVFLDPAVRAPGSVHGLLGDADGSFFGPMMATATVIVTPLIVAFLLAQRRFIEGITLTGMK